MKLDTKALRYLTAEDWRVLTAVEMGSKNHEVVPTTLIVKIAGLRSGSGVHKSISTLAKAGLAARLKKNVKYDGYRLTYGGLDYLALHTHQRREEVYSVGNQIGVGKESDIYVVAAKDGSQRVMKIHRLGRISFRSVKNNRDYLRNKTTGSWMYMSRLAANKEFVFMKALKDAGFPVPQPIAQSRHTIIMELIDAFPLRQISEVPDPAGLYAELMALIVRLAEVGLIHGDFNEFNILVKEEPQEGSAAPKLTPIIIDFPQMVSISHSDAGMYFDRDVKCIKSFFERRFGFVSAEDGPFLSQVKAADAKPAEGSNLRRLDLDVEASGFSRKMAKELESYMKVVGVEPETEEFPRPQNEGLEDEQSYAEPEEDEPEEDVSEEDVSLA